MAESERTYSLDFHEFLHSVSTCADAALIVREKQKQKKWSEKAEKGQEA